MKQCNYCKEEKDLSCFSKHPRTKDKLHTTCRTCRNLQEKQKYASGVRKKRISTYTYEKYLKWEYNITQQQYDKLYTDQSGKCLICLNEDKLVVDHCHVTNKVRGLLCTRCNTGLGKFKDNIDSLKRAIQYLER